MDGVVGNRREMDPQTKRQFQANTELCDLLRILTTHEELPLLTTTKVGEAEMGLPLYPTRYGLGNRLRRAVEFQDKLSQMMDH